MDRVRGNRKTCISVFVLLLIVVALPASGWSPHPQITQATLDVIGQDDPLREQLGPHFDRLARYAWMGDWARSYRKEEDGSYFYADDYLLFPNHPRYPYHTDPGALLSIEPYFRRSVQALRMETPQNAARWIGALLHFTEDAGAPPHALRGTDSVLHHKMEIVSDVSKLPIPGYQPKLLGNTVDEAIPAIMARMEALVAFSKERAAIARPFAEADNREAADPPIIECANESSRVAADVLYTLGRVAMADPPGDNTAAIRGTIRTEPDVPADVRVAKIVIAGTSYSTLADASGNWEIHGLPPGTYTGKVLLPGCRTGAFTVKLMPGETRTIGTRLSAAEPVGNLLRNPGLRVHWVKPDAPDMWIKTKTGWESSAVPVVAGQKYELNIRWRRGVQGTAAVRWHVRGSLYLPDSREEPPVTEAQNGVVFTAPEKMVSACVIIRTIEPITDVCDGVSFAPVK